MTQTQKYTDTNWLFMHCLSHYIFEDFKIHTETSPYALGTFKNKFMKDYFIELSSQPLTLQTLGALNSQLKQWLDSSMDARLVLFSQCPGYAENTNAQYQKDLALQAGLYRQLQEQWKAKPGRIISVVDTVAVGGTYLIHGLSADIRIATSNTRFYGAKPPQDMTILPLSPLTEVNKADLKKAKMQGLVSHIVKPQVLCSQLINILYNEEN